MKEPTKVPEVVRFLGMVGWLIRFIPRLADLVAPLNKFKKKNASFLWGEKEKHAYQQIRHVIYNTPILRHPKFNERFYVHTDASDTGLGAVLLQKNENGEFIPIEFASRQLSPAERNWTTTEKELIAIVWACEKWEKYLLLRQFSVATDHKNLEALFKFVKDQRINSKYYRWVNRLSEFDFIAEFIPGAENVVADYLSRYDIDLPETIGQIKRRGMEKLNAISHRINYLNNDTIHYFDSREFTYNISYETPKDLQYCFVVDGENVSGLTQPDISEDEKKLIKKVMTTQGKDIVFQKRLETYKNLLKGDHISEEKDDAKDSELDYHTIYI